MAEASLILGLIISGFTVAQNTALFVKTLQSMHNHADKVVYQRVINPKAGRNARCWKRCQRMAK